MNGKLLLWGLKTSLFFSSFLLFYLVLFGFLRITIWLDLNWIDPENCFVLISLRTHCSRISRQSAPRGSATVKPFKMIRLDLRLVCYCVCVCESVWVCQFFLVFIILFTIWSRNPGSGSSRISYLMNNLSL